MKIIFGFVVIFLTFFLFSLSVQAQDTTVEDSLFIILKVIKVDKSIVVIKRHKSYIIAKPATRADGAKDNSLREYILNARKENNKSWIHDNTLFSRIQGYGRESYRQTTRPSMHVVFFIKDGEVETIHLDMDRFPPGGNQLISSVRHLFQERLPNRFLRKQTDPIRMLRSVEKLYPNKTAQVSIANTPL